MPSPAAHALSLLFRFTRMPRLATESAARAGVPGRTGTTPRTLGSAR